MPATGKVLRGCRASWLKIGNSDYTLLGKDMDSLSIENNYDTEQTKNVLGETTFNNKGASPNTTIEYQARYEDAIYPELEKADNELSKDVPGEMIVATLDKEVKDATGATTLTGTGYKVPVQIVVNSSGGDTGGLQYSFSVNEDGARVQGNVSVTEKVPTFLNGGVLSALNITSVLGSTTGKTALTVSPSLSTGNSYRYKVGTNAAHVEYGSLLGSWSAWDGISEIEADDGKKITIAECDGVMAVAAGTATVVSA